MTVTFEAISPPIRLALAYAPNHLRVAFGSLLLLDERLAEIVGRASEPVIAQLKLAWWRDALASGPDQRPKGEPLLAALFEQDMPSLISAAGQLVDAWEILLGEEQWSDDTIEAFAGLRADAVFGGYGKIAGKADVPKAAGREWAIRDLQTKFGLTGDQINCAAEALPANRGLRPLTLLTMLARGISGPRFIWHGLTGR